MTTTSQAKRKDDGARAEIPPPPGSIADLYREVLPVLDFEAEQTKLDVAITVAPADLHSVIATGHRDDRLAFDLLRNQTAVDWEEEGIEVVYHLYSTRHRHSVCLKTRVRGDPKALPTVTDIYRGADWAERETREMFGIEFTGHPDPRNLLLDEDLDIHPLLKSHPLAEIEIPQGIDVEYFTKQHPPAKQDAEDAERAARVAAAKAKAAAGEKKSDADLTPEELAAKKAAQAERVKKAREIAAARRAEGPANAMKAKSDGPAAAGTADAAAEAPAAPKPKTPASAEAPSAQTAPKKATADMTPEEIEERKRMQAERVKKSRELAAARRAELRGEG
jgi:NADH-quinone oxidoreductase subunit C